VEAEDVRRVGVAGRVEGVDLPVAQRCSLWPAFLREGPAAQRQSCWKNTAAFAIIRSAMRHHSGVYGHRWMLVAWHAHAKRPRAVAKCCVGELRRSLADLAKMA